MRKIIALFIAICLIFPFLYACKAQKTELSDTPSKETFGGSAENENEEDNGTQTDPNTSGIEDDTPPPEKPADKYVQPTTFAKAYSNVSALRNAFYDILSTSLTSAKESSQVLIDTYEVMSGESSFVVISACGSGADDIIKTSLAVSGYKDVDIKKSDKGEYNITLKVPVSDMFSEDELFSDGSFYVYYDTENDTFICEYTVLDLGTEKFRAKRIDGGYIADYLAPDGKYLRFILMDDHTGKALIYGSSHWEPTLPESSEGFDIDGYDILYELTDSKFYSKHYGVDHTFHKVLPESLVEEE